MNINQRIEAFVNLGDFLRSFNHESPDTVDEKLLADIVENDHIYNPWFTKENILQSIKAIGDSLRKEKFDFWIKRYNDIAHKLSAKRIGVVTAGNIPLVGFHDFMTVLISGNIFLGKLSSKDNRLLKFIADFLIKHNSEFSSLINFTEGKLEKFDAIIATGSNNTARYFEYYFGKYPNIIRKNRNSVAVLTGTESAEEIKELGTDIFSYFGLGCRNVSKLIIPKDYCFDPFFENIQHFESNYIHNKYANNYDYNKSVYLMNQIQHFDNGFIILKEDYGIASPIGVLYFQYYDHLDSVKEYLKFNEDLIQCVVSGNDIVPGTIPFGKAQSPELWDYADNIDTMEFLLNLK